MLQMPPVRPCGRASRMDDIRGEIFAAECAQTLKLDRVSARFENVQQRFPARVSDKPGRPRSAWVSSGGRLTPSAYRAARRFSSAASSLVRP
jgi:hypothetical protein